MVSIIFYNQISKGKKISIGIIVATNICYILVILSNLIRGIGGTFLNQLSLILVSILVSFMFYKGSSLARHVMGGLLGLVVWMITLDILEVVGLLTAFDGWLMLILILVPVCVAISLSFNKNISKFVEYQTSRQKNEKNRIISYIIFFGFGSFVSYFEGDIFHGIFSTIPLIYYVVKLFNKSK